MEEQEVFVVFEGRLDEDPSPDSLPSARRFPIWCGGGVITCTPANSELSPSGPASGIPGVDLTTTTNSRPVTFMGFPTHCITARYQETLHALYKKSVKMANTIWPVENDYRDGYKSVVMHRSPQSVQMIMRVRKPLCLSVSRVCCI